MSEILRNVVGGLRAQTRPRSHFQSPFLVRNQRIYFSVAIGLSSRLVFIELGCVLVLGLLEMFKEDVMIEGEAIRAEYHTLEFLVAGGQRARLVYQHIIYMT
jgi:hypothetical protein